MGRRTDNQKAVAAVKEASGSRKLNKRKRQEDGNMKLSSFLLKHLKRTTDSSSSPQKPDDQTTSETESFQDQGSKNVTVTIDDNRVEGCASLNDECLEKVESVVSHQTYSQNPNIQDGSSKDLKNDDHKDEGCTDSRQKCQVVTKILTETAVTFSQSPDSATSKNISCKTVLCSPDRVSDTNFGDPSTWPFPLLPSFKDSIIKKGPVQCILENYPKVDGRGFHRCHFTNTSTDSLKSNRRWLLYSQTTNSLFCFPCCLFSSTLKTTNSPSPFTNYGTNLPGFSRYDKLSRGIKMHEDSHQHMLAEVSWSNYVYRLENGQTIDEKESSSWKLVLKCMLDAIMFLAKNNLALRGGSEHIGNPGCGNFLSLLELLSHYYSPLATHIERMKPGRVNYMSHRIQDEFVSLSANFVRSAIISKVKERKYFSILLDATPDCANQEQISQVIRSVNISGPVCKVEEHFLDFIHFDKKTGKSISDMIVQKLNDDGLDIQHCRGQGYDNGANMAGIYNGVQAHIQRINSLAQFVPCAAHSLNLVGHNAATKVLPSKLILGQVQNLYAFFAASPERWSVLTAHVKLTLKSQSSTRWSSKANAVHALSTGFHSILEALEVIVESESFNAQTLADATCQLNQISTFKFLLGVTIWNDILHCINIVNVAIQGRSMDVEDAVNHLNGLLSWLNEFLNTGFKYCLEKAEVMAAKAGVAKDTGFNYRVTRCRVPARFRLEESTNVDIPESNLDKFEREFFKNLLARIIEEFGGRFQALRVVASEFGFMWGHQLESNSTPDLINAVKDLALKYHEDQEGAKMLQEIGALKSSVEPFVPPGKSLSETSALDILNILNRPGLKEAFNNCHMAIRIFLTVPVTVATNERAFSKLKLIKNYLRSTMGQERLRNLAILSIEHSHARDVCFDEVIEKFVAVKSRKIKL